MPDNFIIVPASDITSGRIDSLANARHATDLNPTVEALPNGEEVFVFRLSTGIAGVPTAVQAGPVTIEIDDVAYPDFPVVVEPDLLRVTIPLSGSLSAPVAGLEGRLIRPDGSVVQGWTALQALQLSGTAWSATLSAIPGPDRYLAEVRPTGQTESASQTVPFRTAATLAAYGQSNTILFSETADPAVTPRGDVFHLRGGVQGPPVGGGMTTLLNELAAATGISWVGITGGNNGVSIEFLDNVITGGIDSNTDYLDNLRADIALTGRRPTLAVFHQGENNAATADGLTITSYAAAWDNIWDTIAADYPEETAPFPKFIASLATDGDGVNARGWSTVDQWHRDLVATRPDVFWGGSWKDARRIDRFHGYGEDYTRRGARTAEHIKAYFGRTTPFTEFRIAAASIIDATTTDVTVAHGQGNNMSVIDVIENQLALGANTSEVRGFEVQSSGGYVPATGSIVNATTIRLTHADIGTASRNLRYLYGSKPDTNGMVVDNSPEAVPLLHTGITPILCSGSAAATEFAQQAFAIDSTQRSFRATSLLPGAERFLYTVQINRTRTLAFTNGGVPITPLAVIDAPNSDGNGSPEPNADKMNRLYVFETTTLDEIGIALSGGGFSGNHFGITLTEARGTSGGWSVEDIVARMPVDRDDTTLTHDPLTIPEGSVVSGILIGDDNPNDLSAYVSTEGQSYSPGFGGSQAVVATALASGTVTYYQAVLTGGRRRMGSVIASIAPA